MRQQYHMREVAGDQYIWDVNKLAVLAKALPARSVPLTAIAEIDELYWYQHKALPTCRSVAEHSRLIMQADLRYPILLCAEGRILDGMHRVCRALIEGQQTIDAKQFSVNPPPDYVNVALEDLPYDDYRPL